MFLVPQQSFLSVNTLFIFTDLPTKSVDKSVGDY